MNVSQITAAIIAAHPSKQPLMIWGPPGVGKSSGVAEAARQLQEITYPSKEVKRLKLKAEDAKFGFIDLRLSLMDPVDLRGLPYREGTETKWARPSWLPSTGKGIILLDEIVQAVPMMQAAASQLVLDRRIGEHALGDGWHVIAAGNRLSDRAATNAMPTHIANRFVHLYAEVDVDSWVKWALLHDIDIRAIAFIKFRRTLLHVFDAQNKGQAFASPRSWEFVGKLIDGYQGDRQILTAMIKGAVGDGPGSEFDGFLRVFDKMPSIDGILLNPGSADIPSDPATLYAVISALSHKASKDNIASIAKYFNRISDSGHPDFSIAAMKEISGRDAALTNTRPFIEWASKHNHIIN